MKKEKVEGVDKEVNKKKTEMVEPVVIYKKRSKNK